MPFVVPFKTVFRPGDLIYGLTRERLTYFGKKNGFSPHHLPQLIAEGNFVTIDQYSPFSILTRKDGHFVAPPKQRDFFEALRSHPKYASILQPGSQHDQNAINRKCKGGLFWIATLDDDTMVHFILDGIDFDHVVHKSLPQERSVTGSELRWVYRNRHDPRVQLHVQFWLRNAPVPPPWAWSEVTTRLWFEYDLHRDLAKPADGGDHRRTIRPILC